jgi:sodium-dependent dicarboxylate transporter 2/3/5
MSKLSLNNAAQAKDYSSSTSAFRVDRRQLVGGLTAILAFLAAYFGLPASFDGGPRAMIAIVCGSIILWILEVIPLGMTAILIMVLMLLLKPVPVDIVYKGFSSSAIFLIIGGMMLAKAVNETGVAKRVTYHILGKWGGNAKGLLGSILIIPQVQSFFIPAAAVRTSLLLPVALNVLDTIKAKRNSGLRYMILLAVAFGGTISGTAVLTAAIGNIITVALVNDLLNVQITYVEWFLYSLPLWLLTIPGAWFILLKCFPLKEGERDFPQIKPDMKEKIEELGPLTINEKKCLISLSITVLLWMTEPLHGLDPSIPALLCVIFMTMPGLGCVKWSTVVNINFDTVILLGATLSMGYAMNESGAAAKIGELLATPWVLALMQDPISGLIFIILVTQLIHLLIANVSTAVVTLIPIYIGIANQAGLDPLVICVAAGLTCLHGFILVVENMTSVVVHSTGQISQKEFIIPGLFITIFSTVVTLLMAFTWWRWLGLY